jgi:hypothetical protein
MTKSAKIVYLTSDKCQCHAVTPKRPKILKMQKMLNSYMTKYLCSCDTALCDIFDAHLKDGRRHRMDTYLLIPVLYDGVTPCMTKLPAVAAAAAKKGRKEVDFTFFTREFY